ncbi:hypothetical protein LCGC14_0799490 [marine sediment metagenome]|uniref:Uncharacterized protein n=1 Tax=marine sediment metagenome TaxID=412755 RepID=A0A0F9PUL2_9ZZZZ
MAMNDMGKGELIMSEKDHIITMTVLEIGDLAPFVMRNACGEFGPPMAARNTGKKGLWYGLRYFSYGKGCVGRVQQAVKDKSVQLLIDKGADGCADSSYIMGKDRRCHGNAGT